MADNTTLPGTGEQIRDIDKGGKKSQVMILDIGGAGAEKLADENNPVPTKDDNAGNLLLRVLQMLLAPLGYDKSLQRYRNTVVLETPLPTLGNVTTLGTITNAVPIGSIASIATRNADMLLNAQVNANWALNVRARIT